MATATIKNDLTVDGVTYRFQSSVTSDSIIRTDKTGDNVLAVAKIGQLTTRTDNDTGELTMNASHGITTGVRLDVYWSTGSRRGMTVGTVSTNQVPIDGGAGDNLPTNLTAITAFVPIEEEFLVTGDNVQFIFAKANRKGIIVFADSSDVELAAVVDPFETTNGGGYQWFTGSGVTNPLATDDVAKVFFSNGDSANENAVQVGVGVTS